MRYVLQYNHILFRSLATGISLKENAVLNSKYMIRLHSYICLALFVYYISKIVRCCGIIEVFCGVEKSYKRILRTHPCSISQKSAILK